MLMFIVFGATVFYTTGYYEGHATIGKVPNNFGWYLYWTYEYSFGNYEYGSMKELNNLGENQDSLANLINFFQFFFAFFFTFLLTNV